MWCCLCGAAPGRYSGHSIAISPISTWLTRIVLGLIFVCGIGAYYRTAIADDSASAIARSSRHERELSKEKRGCDHSDIMVCMPCAGSSET